MFRRVCTLTCVLLLAANQTAVSYDGMTKIQELRQEKLVLLMQIHDLLESAYKKGEAKLVDVLRARIAYQQAAVEIAETQQQRIIVLEEMVRIAETMVAATTALFKANEATMVDVRKAQVVLVERKIALEHEMMSSRPPKP